MFRKVLLNRDLAPLLRNGAMSGTGAGLSTGLYRHGKRQVFTYGTATPDPIFDIGSISKTFTGLALAEIVARGKAKFDEPTSILLFAR